MKSDFLPVKIKCHMTVVILLRAISTNCRPLLTTCSKLFMDFKFQVLRRAT